MLPVFENFGEKSMINVTIIDGVIGDESGDGEGGGDGDPV